MRQNWAQWAACSAHLTATLHVVARMLGEGLLGEIVTLRAGMLDGDDPETAA
jgi:hypothetical protein